ncbi:hypothetical protein KMZ29_16695 [Bradyrhizobium sediminis]|uniref:Uncharacterized protein n=1 Tax=Bradyrhizobium sediminis TaxID=2840469 RepID=A0A975NIT0_9BRAD|nr:hypothetical protein [Bradyrhizobium sediminis]QWG15962.1 hypothetical protein KMZ29_16695 [Bradyrhizobium sediminis]
MTGAFVYTGAGKSAADAALVPAMTITAAETMSLELAMTPLDRSAEKSNLCLETSYSEAAGPLVHRTIDAEEKRDECCENAAR